MQETVKTPAAFYWPAVFKSEVPIGKNKGYWAIPSKQLLEVTCP
jgi:hypothetical protein